MGTSFEPQFGLSASEQGGFVLMLVVWTVIFVAVLGAMLGCIVKQRRSCRIGLHDLRQHVAADLVWTLVPLCLVVLIALLAVRAGRAMYGAGSADELRRTSHTAAAVQRMPVIGADATRARH
jgi:heme/copper-type cytochrome/quinol oxidase subunit 2